MKTATSKFNALSIKASLFAIAFAISSPAQAGVRYLSEGDEGPAFGLGLLEKAIDWVSTAINGIILISLGK